MIGTQLVPAALESPALSASDPDGKTIFPFGTHVYREPHLPLEPFRHDFPILKKLGFNMIKIQEVWASDERREGEIDLSNVLHVIADARQNRLRVYFGVTMENAPAWLWRKYPDATMVYETGEPHGDPTQYVLPDDGKPGPCWHHPQARAAGIRFVEAVARDVGKHDNIEIWNVFQEIGLWRERPGHLGLCYCQYTLPAFRAWLRTRYGSLDDLNTVWRSGYGDWDEIDPPRFSPKVPSTIDFRYFMDDVYLSDSVRWKADAFRRSDPMHRPVLAHVGGLPSVEHATGGTPISSTCSVPHTTPAGAVRSPGMQIIPLPKNRSLMGFRPTMRLRKFSFISIMSAPQRGIGTSGQRSCKGGPSQRD